MHFCVRLNMFVRPTYLLCLNSFYLFLFLEKILITPFNPLTLHMGMAAKDSLLLADSISML